MVNLLSFVGQQGLGVDFFRVGAERQHGSIGGGCDIVGRCGFHTVVERSSRLKQHPSDDVNLTFICCTFGTPVVFVFHSAHAHAISVHALSAVFQEDPCNRMRRKRPHFR